MAEGAGLGGDSYGQDGAQFPDRMCISSLTNQERVELGICTVSPTSTAASFATRQGQDLGSGERNIGGAVDTTLGLACL